MSEGKVTAVYLGLVVRPYRFVVERRLSPTVVRFERHSASTLRELMLGLFEILAAVRSDFAKRLSSLDDGRFIGARRKRRFIAVRRDLLYIGSPQLEKHAVEFHRYWVATNIGHKEVGTILRLACQAAGVNCQSVAKLTL
jgi:hypothetical protein